MNELVAVVLDFRTPTKTLDCLDSLAGQGVRRVVLVENSEDGGASIRAMQAGLDELRVLGVAIEVLDEGRNLGFAAGVNRALACIRRTGAADVLLINSDARLMPGCLESMRSALYAGADVVVPMLVSMTGEKHRPVAYYQRCTAIMTKRALPGSFAYATGACMLLSESLVDPGLFDEDFFFYGEDVMLSMTILARGKCWVVREDASVLHEGSGSARNGSLFYEYHINRGHLLLADKLCPGRRLHFPLLASSLLLRAVVRSIRSRSTIPARGLQMAFASGVHGRPAHLTPEGAGKN